MKNLKYKQIPEEVLRTTLFLFYLIAFSLWLTFSPTAQAAVENKTCTIEPTDMIITYGNLISCSLDTSGDTDIFRFSGSNGEKIVIQSAWQSGGVRPCIELHAPDGTHTDACAITHLQTE